MIISWLAFIVVALITYAGFLKLAARVLHYNLSWKSSFLFAGIILIAIICEHVLVVRESVAIRIVYGVVLVIGLAILGSWFFSGRGTNSTGTPLGWSGGLRLMALTFAMMIVVVFAIVAPAQIFLSKHVSPSP